MCTSCSYQMLAIIAKFDYIWAFYSCQNLLTKLYKLLWFKSHPSGRYLVKNPGMFKVCKSVANVFCQCLRSSLLLVDGCGCSQGLIRRELVSFHFLFVGALKFQNFSLCIFIQEKLEYAYDKHLMITQDSCLGRN